MKVKKVLQLSLATLFVATAAMGISSLQKETVFAEAAQAEWATGNSQVSVTMNYDLLNSAYGPLGWRFHVENFASYQTALQNEDFLYIKAANSLKPMFYETKANAENPSINLGYYDGDFKTMSTPVQSVKGGSQVAMDYYGIVYTFTDTVTGEYFNVKMYSDTAVTTRGKIAISVNGGEYQAATVFQGNFTGRFDCVTTSPFSGTLYFLNLKYDQDENKIKFNRDLGSSFDLSKYGLSSAFETYKVDLSFDRIQADRTAKLCVYYLNDYNLTATTNVNNLVSNGETVYQKSTNYECVNDASVNLSEVIGAWDTALGDVTAQTQYTVQDAQGADVAVENGVFVAPASGDYTVSATYGSTTKNFTVGVTIPSVSYPEGGVIVQKARLNLEGKIGVQFLVSADETVYDAEGGKVVFTVADETTEVAFTDWMASGNDYIVECEVAAKQMTDTISMQFVDKNGVVSAEMTYSVREYADTVLAGENEAAKELVKATLNYGAYAQVYFNYNVENLANAGLYEEGQNPVEGMEGVAQAAVTADSTVEGVSLKSLSLGLETETEVYVLFALAEGVAMSDVTFAVEGVNVEAVETNGGAYIVIKNVAAKDVDKDYTVTVTYCENTATYTVSAQCYISAAFGKTANTAYDNLLKAIELYNVAANAYFA